MEDVDLPISGAEVGLAARIGAALARTLRRPDPVLVLKQKEAVRTELRANLPPKTSDLPEIILVRLGHEDAYGKPDLRFLPFGTSPWLKFEVESVHDRGLEVVIAIEFVVIKRGKATLADESTPGAIKVFVIGRVPYERIRHIDWSPDPYYGRPRLYVKYGRRGPCKEVVLYEPPTNPDGYLYEIPDVRWKGERSRRKRLWRKVLSVKMVHEDRQNMRKMRDGKLEL